MATKAKSLDVRANAIAACAATDAADRIAANRLTTSYRAIRTQIQDGDLLAFRGRGLIARHGQSKHTHIGTAVWRRADQDTLLVAESRETHGGRIVSLSSQVKAFPGMIDVYRPHYQCPPGVRLRAATICVNWAGGAYNWRTIFRMGLMHAPIMRAMIEWYRGRKYDPNDRTLSTWEEAKVCSQLHAWAYRLAIGEMKIRCDWDPYPGLGDRWIEPGHLTNGGSYRLVYKGLTP